MSGSAGTGPPSLLSKSLGIAPIEIVDGRGLTLIAANGERFLDTCGGVAVSALGHQHPRVIEASVRASQEVSWVHAGSFTTAAVGELADYVTEHSQVLDHAYFMSGGSEIMEVAIKFAVQHHVESGEPGRTVFVSRRQSYHGSTLGTLALSGNSQRRACYEPLLTAPPVEFVSPCYEYRDRAPEETSAAYVARLARELDDTMSRIGSERVAAFVAEPVVGSTSGAVPAAEGYLAAVREVCDRHGALLLLDEIMCGLGRTGDYFAFHGDDVRPDMVTVGKGLGAGYVPMSALLCTERVIRPIREGSGVLNNGQTHVNSPHGAAVALAVQRVVREEGVLEQSRPVAAHLRAGLQRLREELPYVGDVRGRGLFLGLEFVDPDDGITPLHSPSAFAGLLKSHGLAQGLLLYPGSGTVDGERGAHLLLAPPLISTIVDVEEILGRLSLALSDAFAAHTARR
ncbi:aspartate aminotransferase family protein [Dermacoccus abyssi]